MVTKAKALIAVLLACVSVTQAQVVIETVTVGDPGNPGDTRYPAGDIDSFGGVDYVYEIGKFEVTIGQYLELLNSVAAADPYELYLGVTGQGIERFGNSGSYTYGLRDGDPAWLNRPIRGNLWQACRFANWLHNGQPVGPQGSTTTEDGSYTLDGFNGGDDGWIVRNPGATWVVPTEDEWYKAAYYDAGAAVYYDWPTGSNTMPSNELIDPDPGNNANYDETIGFVDGTTVVGEFENSTSPYGTFDQGGNLWECTYTAGAAYPCLRGGDYLQETTGQAMHASHRRLSSPGTIDLNDGWVGFRVARIGGSGCDPDPDGRATICHRPPGNPDKARTIRVSAQAVVAHLGHGDSCGSCER